MKKFFVLAALAAPLFFFSCAKEMEPALEQDPEETPVVANVAFKASIEELGSPTKADINGENKLVWVAGDQIGIYIPDWTDKNKSFTLVGAGGSTTGGFAYDGGEFSATTASVAYFPWNGTNTETDNNVYDGTLYFKLPQGYYGYTSSKMLTPLVAKITRTGDEYDDIQFKHVGAAVKVTINNLPAYAKSMGLSVEGKQIRGNWHVNPVNAGSEAMSLDAAENTSLNDVWLNFDPSADERPFTFLFPVPTLPASSKLSFSIYDKNDAKVWTAGAKTKGDVALERKNVLAMPALTITTPLYSDYDQISAWGICGSHNGWASDTPMVCEVDGNIHIANDIHFDANAEFKIRTVGSWGDAGTHNFGWSYVDTEKSINVADHDGNIKVTADGTYDIIFNSSSHKITVVEATEIDYPDAGTMPHHTSIKKATDLGATETANCYVITAPGNYKIPVVKGNSSTSAGTVGGVELLWETYNNATSVTRNSVIAAVDWDADVDDYIFFKTPDPLVPGNALIAAKDDSDNIIWSWHIWIPEDEIQTSTYGYIYNHELMDRNLGAIVAATTSSVPVESFGLFYEWGRKDPFVGAKSITSSSFAKVYGTEITQGYEMTMAQTIANPTVYAVYTKADSWGNWTAEDGAGSFWNNSVKTIYDPCPAGYRVPAYNTSQLLHSSNLSTVKGWSDNAAAGVNAAYFTLGDPVTVFPFTGLLSEAGDEISYNGGRNFIWSAEANGSNNGRMMDVRQGTSTHTVTTTVTSRGCSVRCVKIEEAPAPEVPAPTPATGIVLDGVFSDWADGDELDGDDYKIIKWKYAYDASNLYFYIKMPVSKINFDTDEYKSDKTTPNPYYLSYRLKRYIYIALDTDADTSTGKNPGKESGQYDYGGLTLPGCDALALVYPFNGTASSSSATTPDGLTFVNGVDDQGWTRVPPTGSRTGKQPIAYGLIDGSYAYLEIGIPMNGIGSPSPSRMKLQFSCNWDLAGIYTIETK